MDLLYTRSGSGNYSDLCVITRHLLVYSYLQRGVDGFPARTLEGAKTNSYHNLPSQTPELFRQDDLLALESGSSGTLERWCLNKIQSCCYPLYIKPNSSITGFQPLFPKCNYRSAAGGIHTPLVYTLWVGCIVNREMMVTRGQRCADQLTSNAVIGLAYRVIIYKDGERYYK